MNYEDADRIEHGEVLRRSDPLASHSADGDHNRTANAVDHYSLVLQVIQVVPVITAFIVHAIADDLLANLLSWLFLLVGTGSVVWIEHVKRHRDRDRRTSQPSSHPQVEPLPPSAPPPVPVVTTSTTEAGITISIWVGQPVHDGTATERRRVPRSAKARQRARNRPPHRA